MYSLDVNVLLYAASPSSQEHLAAREAVEQARTSVVGLGLQSVVASSFIRIATDPRAVVEPLSTHQAMSFIDAVLDAPRARVTQPGAAHWTLFHQLCTEFRPRRSDVTDCWLAAAALEVDAVWLSFDRGFARFRRLRWVDPASQQEADSR
jgi:toxin-antitoxin system PIN domain toxin